MLILGHYMLAHIFINSLSKDYGFFFFLVDNYNW